jgi:hypothetical protein
LLVHVLDEPALRELVSFLEAGALVVRPRAPHAVEVDVPLASTRDEAKRDLTIYLATWRAMHPGVAVRLTAESSEPLERVE